MSTRRELDRVSERALKMYGTGPQTELAIEECAEFIVAIKHFLRGKATVFDLYGEIADVTIMMAQMRLMVGAAPVDRAICEKLARQTRRMDERELDGEPPT